MNSAEIRIVSALAWLLCNGCATHDPTLTAPPAFKAMAYTQFAAARAAVVRECGPVSMHRDCRVQGVSGNPTPTPYGVAYTYVSPRVGNVVGGEYAGGCVWVGVGPEGVPNPNFLRHEFIHYWCHAAGLPPGHDARFRNDAPYWGGEAIKP